MNTCILLFRTKYTFLKFVSVLRVVGVLFPLHLFFFFNSPENKFDDNINQNINLVLVLGVIKFFEDTPRILFEPDFNLVMHFQQSFPQSQVVSYIKLWNNLFCGLDLENNTLIYPFKYQKNMIWFY